MYYARTEPRAGKRKAETVAAIVKRRKTGGSAEKLRNELFRLTRLVTKTGGAVFHSHYKRHFNGVDIHDRYIYKSVSRHHHREWTAALVFWFIRSGMVNVWTVINMSFALDRHSFRDRLVASCSGSTTAHSRDMCTSPPRRMTNFSLEAQAGAEIP